MNDILSGTYKGNTYRIKVECYPNTPAIKVQLLPVNAGERITMTQNLGQPLPRYQAFLCDGMLEVDSTAFMDYKKMVQECVGVTCTKLSSPWTVYLSTLIAAHYCCRPYRSHAHGSKVSEIGFIGMEDDFKLCKLAFLYAYDCIASRCRQIRTQKEYSAKALREMCNSYGWGFCRGLSAAFQKQEAEHQEWGLVMVVPQAVEDAVSKMKRSSYKISSTSSMNRQYAAMGYADGQEFDMRRRLEPSA